MENYVGVLAMCVISGALAALVHMLWIDHTNKSFIVKNIYFYVVVFYGVMSVIKVFKGEGRMTLFTSFINIESTTYIHYGIPLAIGAVALPFLIKFIFGYEKGQVFIGQFCSVFSFVIGLEFLVCGVITSYNYIIVCIAAFLISLGVVFLYKGEVRFCKKGEAKDRLLFILPIIFLWTITVLIFEPNQMLLINLDEFSIPYFSFLGIMLVEGAVLTMVYLLIGVFILSDRQLKAFGTIIFGISIAGYVQGNFLNGEMLLMDGTVQTWGSTQKIVNGIVWLVIVALAVYVNYNARHRSICKKIVQGICVFICLMQVLSLIFMIITTEFPDEEDKFVLTTNSMLELDKENNVIVFILDWFDRQIMDDILEQQPDFTKNLKDFTDYTNATSCYAYTAMSVPYLLTGVEWEYEMGSAEYCKYAYERGSFLSDIESKNYSMGVYTGSSYVGDSEREKLLNYSNERKMLLGFKKAFYVMNDTSKYKMAPFAAKQFFFYTTDDVEEIVLNSGKYTINNDIAFHSELQRKKLSFDTSGDYSGAFRFYHLKGAHALFNMNENFEEVKEDNTQLSQARGSLKIVYEYIDEMKKLGIYDNATIIITADHGQNANIMKKSDSEVAYDMTSTPILFVKLPDEHHDEGPIISSAPVSHTEFAATVINAIGGDYTKYGRTFAEIGEDEIRERIFVQYAPSKGKYNKYAINGDANEADSWTLVDSVVD